MSRAPGFDYLQSKGEVDASSPLPQGAGSPALPRNFRKLPIDKRRQALKAALGAEFDATPPSAAELEWSDTMVESAIGFLAVPVGVATGFLIDGTSFSIPMAVEEPSVIAAATFAGSLIAGCGGFRTWSTEPEMVSQIFLEGVSPGREHLLAQHEPEIEETLASALSSMRARGGGYRGMKVSRLEEIDVVRVDLLIDVRDVMGANIINTAAEKARRKIEEVSGGTALMCILTNESLHRRAGARFSVPLARLKRGRFDGIETGRRIAHASEVARVDPSRAVTHNKGVMNGITALALATGNDTRGIEAAVHRWASRDGQYRGVTSFRVEGANLLGRIEIPLPLATAGGAVGFHPSTRSALALLGNPDTKVLSRVGAALGLAQNFAALYALVTEGIQRGHMKMHSARLALLAGARGGEVRRLAERIADAGTHSLEAARQLLEHLRLEGR